MIVKQKIKNGALITTWVCVCVCVCVSVCVRARACVLMWYSGRPFDYYLHRKLSFTQEIIIYIREMWYSGRSFDTVGISLNSRMHIHTSMYAEVLEHQCVCVCVCVCVRVCYIYPYTMFAEVLEHQDGIATSNTMGGFVAL